MHICFFSNQPRPLPDEDADLQKHRVSHVSGDLDALPSIIQQKSPDIVFVCGFDQNASLLAALRNAASASPSTILIPIIQSPQSEFLLEAMRAGVREVLASESINEINRAIARISGAASSGTKHSPDKKKSALKIGFMAAKGGDGSSCISANFASALAQHADGEVLLLDVAVPFGDVEMYVTNTNPPNDLFDITNEIDRLDSTLLASLVHHISDHLDLMVSPRSFEKVLNLQPQNIERAIDIAAQSYQFVVFDINSSFDSIGIQAIEKLDRLFLVVTQNVSSIRRADRILQLLETLEFPMGKVSVVLNKFSAKEPIGSAEVEGALRTKVASKLALEVAGMRESAIKGLPCVNLYPKSEFSKGILGLAEEWLGEFKEEKSVWHRFGIR